MRRICQLAIIKRTDDLEYLGIECRMILKWMSEKWDVSLHTGLTL